MMFLKEEIPGFLLFNQKEVMVASFLCNPLTHDFFLSRFPLAQDPLPVPMKLMDKLYSLLACQVGGVSVVPQKGKAILFYSLEEDGHMDGVIDPLSLHASCPTLIHEKWLANQWFRNKRVKVNGKWHLYDNNW